ncbi:MAG: DEAD/DEAH box helicase, partial [Candidatus Cloacimonadaceae bacterium]|nr:DEAD/DEAH box helicase [Candidatus Cloacimonadaceae bacterium]
YKDFSFSHDELKKYFNSGQKFLHTNDGRIVFITNRELFDETEKLLAKSERQKDDVYKARVLNLPYYMQLRESNPAFRLVGDDFIRRMFTDLLARKMEKTDHLPHYLMAVMRSYQKAGFAWLKMLENYRLNGILADEMGLGKTLQALSLIADSPDDSISLVICPKTLLYNWAAEIEKFHTNIPYLIVEGDRASRSELIRNPNVRLLIISYSIATNDIDELLKLQFNWIILDEAQNIKNVSTMRSTAIKKLKARHKVALSGTPIENKLTEIWSIFDFLMPGYLGTLNRFKKEFSPDLEDSASRLHRYVAPFLLRRTKKEVLLELPDKQEQVSWCKLTPVQEKLYLQIIEQVKKQLFKPESTEMNYIHILSALTKLRQICNHPSLISADIKSEAEVSSKLEQLLELVNEAIQSGHKILVFSQFVQMLKIIRKAFDEKGLANAYMDGQTKERMSEVQRFNQDKDLKLFLISLKTGGVGLNLTAADTVILFDPWWNPMIENQAIDRTHRIGQTRKVQVIRLITKGTVEEKIIALQHSKLDLFKNIVEDGQQLLKTISIDDMKGLFHYGL